MLQYSGLLGNVFSHQSIADCQKLGEKYNPENINPKAKKSVGLDPGFGSSNFAIVASQLVNGKIQIIYASEYPRPSFTEMINEVWKLKQRFGYISNIYVDASNPEIIEALKREFQESTDWQYIHDQILECRKYNFNLEDRMLVVPTPFSTEGRRMLQHAKFLLEETEEDGSPLIAIHPTYEKLLTSLRTAVATEYKLQKEETVFNDVLDGFLLGLQFYKRIK